jgi:hypothetical protein
VVSLYDSIPPPEGQGGVTIVSGPVATTPAELEPPQSGAHLGLVAHLEIERTVIPLVPEILEEDVREQAHDVIEYLDP